MSGDLPASSAPGPHLDPETRRMQRRIDELTSLLAITKRLHEPFDLDQLLDEIVSICREAMRVEAGALLLADPEQRTLHFHSASGERSHRVKRLAPLRYGQGIAGWVAENEEAAMIDDVTSDPRFRRDIDARVDFESRSILAVPIRGQNDELLGVIEVINKENGRSFDEIDRTYFLAMAEHAAAALVHVQREGERREEMRLATIGSMASSIIHDIKNPMASIKGFAELIANRSPESRRYTDIIVREIDRLVHMTRELLDFSKGVQRIDRESCVLEELLAEIVEFLERDFKGAGIEIALDLASNATVAIDRHKVQRAIFNIASNARDAMDGGGRFHILTRDDPDWIEIVLTDEGEGMSPETADRIFDPFYSTKSGKGTGLGLAIVAGVMKAHHGEVAVETSPGKGTTFTLRFPRSDRADLSTTGPR